MTTGAWICLVATLAAPLLVGGVHRIPSAGLLSAVVLALALFSAGAALSDGGVRFGRVAWLFLVPVVVALLQCIPVPLALRRLVDPVGTALLTDLVPHLRSFPLSLDPVPTRIVVGRSAMAASVFLVVYHLASGQRLRHLFVRALGLTAIAAVVIGIGHKLLGTGKIYGLIPSTTRTLLVGPFVNANHTAEFLELGTFVCLACSLLRPTILNRVGWLAGMVLCAGGTAATLSRGGIVALGVGVVAFTGLRYSSTDNRTPRKRRTALLWGGSLLGIVLLGAFVFGAGQLVDRFTSGSVSGDIRFRLWRDSLKVLRAHPFGIGRGAFDRVFPIYRTIKTPFALRFGFVEDEPLQLLIDCGWLFGAALFLSAALLAWRFALIARRDKIEAALVAGLLAVLAHNLFDFGLEVPGILLPFAGVVATVMGRARRPEDRPSPWMQWSALSLAALGCLFAIISLARSSAGDFDAELHRARQPNERREILARARAAHPIDYFYVLSSAALEPLQPPPGNPSPRLHMLNQALRLCSSCEDVHLQVAQSLWALGLRRQAVMEYGTAVELQPRLFRSILGEVYRHGGTALELAALAAPDSGRMIEAATFLSETGRTSDAIVVLGQAQALGAAQDEILLVRGDLQLRLGKQAEVQQTLAALRANGMSDPRKDLLQARVVLTEGGPDVADRALALLDAAANRYPGDVDIQRERIDVVSRYEKWRAAARAIEGYTRALYARDGRATAAHVASARILGRIGGRWTEALGQYRIALADQPADMSLWMELGQAAEMAGRIETAREAYATAARLSPQNPEVNQALQHLADRRRELSGEGGPAMMKAVPTLEP